MVAPSHDIGSAADGGKAACAAAAEYREANKNRNFEVDP